MDIAQTLPTGSRWQGPSRSGRFGGRRGLIALDLTAPLPPICVPAQKANPFYEEWWFLVVIALVGLIFILLLVFVLIIRGQSKKYAKKTDSGELAPSPAVWTGFPWVCLPLSQDCGAGVLSLLGMHLL